MATRESHIMSLI